MANNESLFINPVVFRQTLFEKTKPILWFISKTRKGDLKKQSQFSKGYNGPKFLYERGL
jgi:hypothetical protein